MKRFLLLLCLWFASSAPLRADDTAIEFAKTHLRHLMKPDTEKMKATYAAEVTLMAGHELLKPKVGISTDPARSTSVKVPVEKIVEAVAKQAGKGQSDEAAAKMVESATFTTIEVKEGDFSIDPSDPVKTPDGKLHFEIKKGDTIIKATQKREFVLLHLRKIDGAWRVVSEYFD